MPEMQDSMSALMEAIFCFTCREASDMLLLQNMTTTRKTGIITATTRASLHSMENMTPSAPKMVRTEISRSSGPWCASSVISKRSPVSLFISFPVRLAS